MKRQIFLLWIVGISSFLSGMETCYRAQNIPAQTIRFDQPSQQSAYSFSCQPRFYRHAPYFSLPKTAPIDKSITKETFAAITKDAQKYGAQSNQKIVKDLEKTVCEQAKIGTIFYKQKQIKPATTIANFCFNVLELMKLLVENGTKKTVQFLHDQKTNLIATIEKCVDHAQKIMFEIGDLKPFPLFSGNELWHENISVIRSEMFHHISKLTAADAASITFSSLLSNYSPVAACLFSLAHFLGSITSSLPPTLPPFAFSASGLASVATCVTPAQLVVAGVGIGLIGACKKRFFEQPIIMRSDGPKNPDFDPQKKNIPSSQGDSKKSPQKPAVSYKNGIKHVEGNPAIINPDKTARHFPQNVAPGKSILYGSLEDAQKLLDEFAGTGLGYFGKSTKKEIINHCTNIIGIYYNESGILIGETSRFTIHYSNTGAHIVPSNPYINL